jgi:tetratricopeptide (TPR) repeat protein
LHERKEQTAEAIALLRSAWQKLKSGDYRAAWQRCQELRQAHPEFAPGWDISSRVALAVNRREDALVFIDQALSRDEGSFAFLSQKAYCLLALRRLDEALKLLDKLEVKRVEHAVECDTLGNLRSLSGDQAGALIHFKNAISLEPDNAHYLMNSALVQQSLGDLDGAELAMDKAIALNPGDYQAWLHRSRLRKQTVENNHVADMENLVQGGMDSWRGEVNLRYALAKEYEDLQNYRVSFRHLKAGSDLRRSHMSHDAQADLRAIEAIIARFPAEFFARGICGFESDEPIFIVGLPRTGTTLLERILGSHSEVYAAGELNNFAECLVRQVLEIADDKPTDREALIALSTRSDFAKLGEEYISSTRPRTGSTLRFIDKLPLNFLYCGLIAQALPGATIIHMTRHPLDACYAIYKTLFDQAYPYSYELLELGEYYLAYMRLMEHWHDVLPGRILDVSYETLVSSLETESKKVFAHCGLAWEDGCLDFYANPAPSMTASLAQVRQPVYTSSVGRWRQLEQELRPLIDLFDERGLAI